MVPIGLTVPKLLPIAGTWAAPFALYYALLNTRIVSERLKSEVYIGDKSTSSSNQATSLSTYKPTPDSLTVPSRCQGNFLENVPLAFLFLAFAELNGGNRKALNYAIAGLLALRIAHAEFGLRLQGKFGDNGIGRPIGYFGTRGWLLGVAGYGAYLFREYWGY